ncbi:zinc-binding protein A33-like [Hoplias malabaricus]|uniref:zinc-binding protein A33-like n=1 Tax=Hoplias malabaricus TaxID=27720 RepID=UPI003462BCDC
MASAPSSLETDLTCTICCDLYEEPLILLCTHSFCRACLERSWKERGAKECPLCRKRSSLDNPPIDRALQAADPIQCLYKLLNSQTLKTKSQIQEEFMKLHQFLREEESRITALEEEKKEKNLRIVEKTRKLNLEKAYLQSRVCSITDYLSMSDASFLQNLNKAQQSAQDTEPNPELDSGALIEVAKHMGNLKYKVWEKMKDICPYFPVILDPNSANKTLSLSEDLVKVTPGQLQDLPDNPERFSVQSFVLGSEGFDSGIHSWEVEAGNSSDWILGVAKKSVKRKKPMAITSEDGIWAFNKPFSQVFFFGGSSSRCQRIRIQLDCFAGQISFYNCVTNQLLHVLNGISREKVYPFFKVLNYGSLKILPAKVSVTHSDLEALATYFTR